MATKKCQSCDEEAIDKERYCSKCKKIVLDKLKTSGQIRKAPRTQPNEQRGRHVSHTARTLGGCPKQSWGDE